MNRQNDNFFAQKQQEVFWKSSTSDNAINIKEIPNSSGTKMTFLFAFFFLIYVDTNKKILCPLNTSLLNIYNKLSHIQL